MDEDFEAVTFGTDTDTEVEGVGDPVTTHSVRNSGDGAGYLDVDTESLANIGRILRNEPEKITKHLYQGPSLFQIYRDTQIPPLMPLTLR